jgi:hypothetical protein
MKSDQQSVSVVRCLLPCAACRALCWCACLYRQLDMPPRAAVRCMSSSCVLPLTFCLHALSAPCMIPAHLLRLRPAVCLQPPEVSLLPLQDQCRLCFASSNRPRHLAIAIGQSSYLALPARGRLVPGHCLIVPAEHTPSTRQVDEQVRAGLMGCVAGRMCGCRLGVWLAVPPAAFSSHLEPSPLHLLFLPGVE